MHKSKNPLVIKFVLRPATTLFQDSFPLKAYCECPVGVSGLTCQDSVLLRHTVSAQFVSVSCHTLTLLLFLQHDAEARQKRFGPVLHRQLQ